MKITLESTAAIVNLKTEQGMVVPARMWVGRTEAGIEIHAFITSIAVHKDDDQSSFERELKDAAVAPIPKHLDGVYDYRMAMP